jgi:hypothetical protein
MMQDAFCPWCAEIFRVRAHSKSCPGSKMELNPELVEVMKRLSEAYARWWFENHAKETLERV